MRKGWVSGAALLALVALAVPTTALAQATGSTTTTAPPPPPAKVCALPFAVADKVEEGLGYRFWIGLMDQLATAQSLNLGRDGLLAKAAMAAKAPLTALREDRFKLIAGALAADWVIGGAVTIGEDGKPRAQGVAFRKSDSSFVRTPNYIMGEGERDKAVSAMSGYLLHLVTDAPLADGKARVPSVDRLVASAVGMLDKGLASAAAADTAGAQAGAESTVEELIGLLESVPPPYPVPALEDLLRSVLVLKPKYVDAVITLGRLHLVRGAKSDAQAAFKWAAELGADPTAVHELIAQAYQRAGMLQDALAEVNAGLQANPKSASLQNTLGLIRREQQGYADAESAFRRAMELDPQGVVGRLARFNLSSMLIKQERADDALKLLDEAVLAAPEDPEVHYNRALALHHIAKRDADQQRLSAALEEYGKTLELNPNHAKAHCNIGVILISMGDTEKAIGHYQKALEADPTLAVAARNLAIAYERIDDKIAAAKTWLEYAEMPGLTKEQAAEAKIRASQLKPQQ